MSEKYVVKREKLEELYEKFKELAEINSGMSIYSFLSTEGESKDISLDPEDKRKLRELMEKSVNFKGFVDAHERLHEEMINLAKTHSDSTPSITAEDLAEESTENQELQDLESENIPRRR